MTFGKTAVGSMILAVALGFASNMLSLQILGELAGVLIIIAGIFSILYSITHFKTAEGEEEDPDAEATAQR